MSERKFPSYQDLLARSDGHAGTAWGVWGDDDQLGTLNRLTPERVRRGMECAITGETVPLNLSLTEFDPPIIAHRGVVEHTVFGLNEFHRDDRLDNFFPQASTQLDGLRHFAHPDHGFYNGVSGGEIVAGTEALGIQLAAEHGIAGRGVLIDIGAFRQRAGRPIDQASNEQIPVDDLELALEAQGTRIEPGDILLIRTGWLQHLRQTRGSWPESMRSPGLEQSERTAEWLWDTGVAVAAADNIALESWPATESSLTVEAERNGSLAPSSHSGMLHRVLIPLLGLTIGELWDLDALAAACARRERYDFFVTAQPLNMPGGVGSPANAMAIL